MPSEAEEMQFLQAMHTLENFVKILVKEYPLVFKNGSGEIILHPSLQHPFFPYTVKLEITKKE